jgi:hypothetical protein
MSFLPADYKEPKPLGNYMKLEDGENNFRILSSAITGWEYWINDVNDEGKAIRKPVRIKPDGQVGMDFADNTKHFWAFVVYNQDAKRIQILEITQRTIQKAIMALIKNVKWGDPKNYDITIVKSGKDLDTEYTVTPNPKEELDKEILKQYEAMNIELEELYKSGDPFKNVSKEEPKTDEGEISLEDIPF